MSSAILRGGLHAETREAALRHAHAAIEAGSDDAMALAMGGFVIGVLERDYETALDALDRSLALSPSSALAFGFSSIIRAWMGDDATAIEHARMGIRLSPYDPLIYLPYVGLAYAHLFTGKFVEAASAASRASAANPRFSVPRYLHAAALVRLGRLDEAKSMAEVLLETAARLHDQRVGFRQHHDAGTHGHVGWRAGSGRIAGVRKKFAVRRRGPNGEAGGGGGRQERNVARAGSAQSVMTILVLVMP